jgi:alanine dehydrogenase
MRFGIPKESGGQSGSEEKRVSLSPSGVRELVSAGAEVVVESGAGAAAGFLDEAYRKAGGQIVYSHEEAFGRSDVVVKVARPTTQELGLLTPGAGVLAFWHLAVALESLKGAITENKVTVIGYEIIQEAEGSLPILRISSEIAGMMAPQIAARLLETGSGGIGILLSGAPGIPPADVVIVGGGTLGYYAARSFLGMGCSVYVLDSSQKRLEVLDQLFTGRIITALATRENLDKYVSFAEVVVGAVLKPGEMAPIVITRDMVKSMRAGSVILDFSFDQGGCVETTRMQGPAGGVFVREGVLHFAVANAPSLVARSATHALTHALLPHLECLQKHGLAGALKACGALRLGCYAYRGQLVSPHVASVPKDLEALLGEG